MSMARSYWRAVLTAVLFLFFIGVYGVATSGAASSTDPSTGTTPQILSQPGEPGGGGEGGDPDEWEINAHPPTRPKTNGPAIDTGTVTDLGQRGSISDVVQGEPGWLWDLWVLLKPSLRALGF